MATQIRIEDADPVLSGAPNRRPETGDLRQGTRRRAVLVGALVLSGLGVLLAALFLSLWPISYDLTQGADFSYEYLVQYQPIWDWFRPILERFESLFPGAASSLEQLTTML